MSDTNYPSAADQQAYLDANPEHAKAAYDQLVKRVTFLHAQVQTNKSADRVLKTLLANYPTFLNHETLCLVPYSELNDKFTTHTLVEASLLLNNLRVPMMVGGFDVDVDIPLDPEFMEAHRIRELEDAECFTAYTKTLTSLPTPPGLLGRRRLGFPRRPIGQRDTSESLQGIIERISNRIKKEAPSTITDYIDRLKNAQCDPVFGINVGLEGDQTMNLNERLRSFVRAERLTPAESEKPINPHDYLRTWDMPSMDNSVFSKDERTTILAALENAKPDWLTADETAAEYELRRLRGPGIPRKTQQDVSYEHVRSAIREGIRDATMRGADPTPLDPDALVHFILQQLFVGNTASARDILGEPYREASSGMYESYLVNRNPHSKLYKTSPSHVELELGIFSRLNRRFEYLWTVHGLGSVAVFNGNCKFINYTVITEGAPIRVKTYSEVGEFTRPAHLLMAAEEMHKFLDDLGIPADVKPQPPEHVFHEFDKPSEEMVEYMLTSRANRRFDVLWRDHGIDQFEFAGQSILLKYVSIVKGAAMRVRLPAAEYIPATRMAVLKDLHGYLDRLEVPAEHQAIDDMGYTPPESK